MVQRFLVIRVTVTTFLFHPSGSTRIVFAKRDIRVPKRVDQCVPNNYLPSLDLILLVSKFVAGTTKQILLAIHQPGIGCRPEEL